MRKAGYNCIRVVTWELGCHKRIFRRLSHKGVGGARGAGSLKKPLSAENNDLLREVCG